MFVTNPFPDDVLGVLVASSLYPVHPFHPASPSSKVALHSLWTSHCLSFQVEKVAVAGLDSAADPYSDLAGLYFDPGSDRH